MNIEELKQLIAPYKPIVRRDVSTEYHCPGKWKSFENENQLILNMFINHHPLSEEDIEFIASKYCIKQFSIEYLLFLYLLQYYPVQQTPLIQTFIQKYMISSNNDVLNLITMTKQSVLNDKLKISEFNKYLFNAFSVQMGRKRVIQNDILWKLLSVIYSSYQLYPQFISFLKSKQEFLTKDQWMCLCSFVDLLLIPQPSEFYLQYSSENSYAYPVLFDEFFLFLKQSLQQH